MSHVSLLAIAVALAMDAFAVAIVSGITLRVLTRRHLFRLGFHFGLFQALMFAAGWFCGSLLQRHVAAFDHWIAFALLAVVGGNIMWSAINDNEVRRAVDPTCGWKLVMLSVATSLDALAVGLSLAIIGISVAYPAVVIGVMAAVLTLIGMALGRRIGALWGRRVEACGGLVLILIGVSIVWEHLRA